MVQVKVIKRSFGSAGSEQVRGSGLFLRSHYLARVTQSALADNEFLHVLSVAQNAAVDGDWPVVQSAGWVALERHRCHAATRTLYARALMEQGEYLWAEINFRSALAEGGDVDVIGPMLIGVMNCVDGERLVSRDICKVRLDVPPLAAPPTVEDIRNLCLMLWQGAVMSDAENLAAMRRFITVGDLARHMIEDERFQKASGDLLNMVAAGRE